MEGVDMGEDFLNHRGTEAQRFLLGGSEINRKDAKAQRFVLKGLIFGLWVMDGVYDVVFESLCGG